MLLDNIKNLERYKDFNWLDPYRNFAEYFDMEDYDLVQVHSAYSPDEENILGFVGVFKWENNKLEPLDGDSYTPDMMVIGYSVFGEDDECLDILVEDW